MQACGPAFLVDTQDQTQNVYEPCEGANLNLSCRSINMPQAWCHGDEAVEQCKAEDNKLRSVEQELLVIV